MKSVRPNAILKGWKSFSPELRGMSYPGPAVSETRSALKGLNRIPAGTLANRTQFAGVVALAFILLGSPQIARAASALPDETLVKIKFDQKLNNQTSLELPFRDESGKLIQLRDCLHGKPAILLLGYYGCPMLCKLVLNGLVESLDDIKLDAGDQFAVINVSIDPNEPPELAAAKKRTCLKRYGRAGTAAGWHFLTGEDISIRKLAAEVGFNYAYDASTKEYAHPSGIIILTPNGKVSRYFFGINFAPKELAAALRQAGDGRTGSPVANLILLCFHYSPLTGKYGPLIMTIVRVSGAATLLTLIGLVMLFSRRKRQHEISTVARPESLEPQTKVARP